MTDAQVWAALIGAVIFTVVVAGLALRVITHWASKMEDNIVGNKSIDAEFRKEARLKFQDHDLRIAALEAAVTEVRTLIGTVNEMRDRFIVLEAKIAIDEKITRHMQGRKDGGKRGSEAGS